MMGGGMMGGGMKSGERKERQRWIVESMQARQSRVRD